MSGEQFLTRYEAGERDFPNAQLRGANLSRREIWRVNFEGANLEGADLHGSVIDCNLRGANLSRAKLQNAKFGVLSEAPFLMHAHLAEARLEHAEAQRVELCFANLRNANLRGGDFEDASLDNSDLSGADLRWAKLRRADLSDADLRSAKLNNADLDGAVLSRVDLENADLREVRGARFDACHVRGARFSPRADDPWSELRRNYTGTMFALHLLLLLAFSIPYLARASFWVGVTQAQESMVEASHRLKAVLRELPHADTTEARRVISALDGMVPGPCLSSKCREWWVWQVLLGADRGWRSAHLTALAVVLILYNVFRAYITVGVGLLRDAEERSAYSPSWDEYRLLWVIHRHFARWVMWVGLLSFGTHLVYWLSRRVWLPV